MLQTAASPAYIHDKPYTPLRTCMFHWLEGTPPYQLLRVLCAM